MKKRILAILLSLLMIASIIPVGMVTASAVSGDEIVSYARQFVGYPYVYGTRGPNSFDCSGLVCYVFSHFGISLPWGTSYIWNNPTAYGTIVGTGSVANAKPGDVISWSGHVAIYSGNGYCIQALNPSYGVTDKVKVNSYSLDGKNPNTNYRVLRIYGVDDNPYFDVNAKVDGVAKGTTDGVATFDVYINGSLVKDNVTDYYVQHARGTKYEVRDIQTKGCYEVVGTGTFSGTLNATTACVLEYRTKHTLNEGAITTEPTCTQKGVKTVACVNCSYTSTAEVEALGHNYSEIRIAPTCTENAKYVSICSRCNDSTVRVVDDKDVWSDWSEEKPDNGFVTESKTQYRYMQYETKVSPESELDGWTYVGRNWGEGKQSTVSYVESFPAGFSSSHSLYTKYNIAPPVSSENATTKVVVGSASTSGYIYWHWCSSKYNGNSPINRLISDRYSAWDSSSNRPYDVFHAFYSTEYRGLTASAGAVNFSNSGACNQTYWWFSAVPVKSVPVTTYEMMYEFTRETGWGEWTDTAPADNSVKYETREVYRYSDSTDLAGHKWDNGKNVNGEVVYSCTVCDEIKKETVVTYIPGDVNCDGKVNAIDARIILRISAQLDKMTNYDIPESVFDLTGDGKVNAIDARKALRIGAQLE